MAQTELPRDFREFLRLLDAHSVEYLLIGGYAVAYHGYPRATADLDVWIALSPRNAERTAAALRDFGFDLPDLQPEIFLQEHKIIRLGRPPLRIEIATTISGVTFAECYRCRLVVEIDGLPVSLIDLEHLKINKRAAGRHKDLDDLENLP